MLAILAVATVFIVLVLAEYLSRFKGVHSELTRKFVHIMVGVFVAFWPFFLTWSQIQLLSLAFLITVLVSIKLNIFRSIHAVQRNAVGEVLFAMIIGLLAVMVTDKWVFAAAMLHLSIADGLAAIVGLGWGDHNRYMVFGHHKSIAGSLAFFFSSLLIMIGYVAFSNTAVSATLLLWLPIAATLVENVAVHGTDNLVIPLLVGLVLTSSL
jgi:dolichol kinase